MAKIFVTRHVPGPGLQMLKDAGHELKINEEDRPLTEEEFNAELSSGEYDGVLSLLTDKIDVKVFDSAPSVKVFSNYAVGFNNIDIGEAKKRGIVISNTPGTSTNAVAEFTIALAMNIAKRVDEGDQFIRDGKYKGWNPNLLIGEEILNKTWGLIGAGRIGGRVAEILHKGFGMKIIYHDIKRNEDLEKDFGAEFKENIEDLIRESDIISLHVLLDETTKHLINKERIEMMKKTAVLVNTSRGPVVDEVAIVSALQNKKIRGFATDVYELEPSLAEGLKELPNVVLTPHIASATEEARNAMSVQAAENLIEFFAGREPKYIVG
jgi:glyoxylate reductase